MNTPISSNHQFSKYFSIKLNDEAVRKPSANQRRIYTKKDLEIIKNNSLFVNKMMIAKFT